MFVPTLLIALLTSLHGVTNGAKILTVAPFFAGSHTKVVQTLNLNLVKRGHEVTAITGNHMKNPPANYHEIVVDYSEFFKITENRDYWEHSHMSVISRLKSSWLETQVLHEYVLKTEQVKDFIKNDKTKFDLIIVEMFFEEVFYLFSHKYKAPLILLETTSLKRCSEDIMGNPFPVSYVPFEFFFQAGELSLLDRLENWFVHIYDYIGRKLFYIPKIDIKAGEIFKHLEKPLPTVEELERNVSLILTNSHYSIDTVLPLVPGIVQIGGIHIGTPKPLCRKIQKFLDEAEYGAIVFTMGTHINISTMEDRKINALLKAFAGLKQRVIMKWENDNPPNIPNVLTLKFIPQNDILAHPNIKAFITHAGMLGVQEAIHYGIPIIGMPLFADQYVNIQRLVHLGAGLELSLLKIDEESAAHALNQIINIPTYRQRALELSKRFNERPMGPVDTAMYWIEYVIKFKGTPFLKSPLVNMPWYKYRMIDVISLVILILLTALKVIFYLIYKIQERFQIPCHVSSNGALTNSHDTKINGSSRKKED